ncbi:MAG: 5-formyltetrahydrofolate cyclo-ligase [Desulfobacterota bacterium]|nr:5-formyltetrahydrofolate cyclo-ligase [Thermodesulfobacteriota bacterium]
MPESVSLLKQKLRAEILNRRNALSVLERQHKSAAIISRLCGISQIADAHTLFIYVSYKSEVATHAAIERFLAEGKTIAVPHTDRERCRIIPVRINSLSELVPGPRGILQPPADPSCIVPAHLIDAVITPGIAFTLSGIRLGYGGGLYDRFFRKHQLPSFALAFELQIIDALPFVPGYDMRVDVIVTEDRLISCRDYR